MRELPLYNRRHRNSVETMPYGLTRICARAACACDHCFGNHHIGIAMLRNPWPLVPPNVK